MKKFTEQLILFMKREEDKQKFRRLATKRVNATMKQLRLISNLSNTSNYSYDNKEVEKIFTALQLELDEAKEHFRKAFQLKRIFTLD